MKEFSDPRWNNTTFPKIVDSREQTEEEKKREKEFNKQLKEWLKDRYPNLQSKKKKTN